MSIYNKILGVVATGLFTLGCQTNNLELKKQEDKYKVNYATKFYDKDKLRYRISGREIENLNYDNLLKSIPSVDNYNDLEEVLNSYSSLKYNDKKKCKDKVKGKVNDLINYLKKDTNGDKVLEILAMLKDDNLYKEFPEETKSLHNYIEGLRKTKEFGIPSEDFRKKMVYTAMIVNNSKDVNELSQGIKFNPKYAYGLLNTLFAKYKILDNMEDKTDARLNNEQTYVESDIKTVYTALSRFYKNRAENHFEAFKKYDLEKDPNFALFELKNAMKYLKVADKMNFSENYQSKINELREKLNDEIYDFKHKKYEELRETRSSNGKDGKLSQKIKSIEDIIKELIGLPKLSEDNADKFIHKKIESYIKNDYEKDANPNNISNIENLEKTAVQLLGFLTGIHRGTFHGSFEHGIIPIFDARLNKKYDSVLQYGPGTENYTDNIVKYNKLNLDNLIEKIVEVEPHKLEYNDGLALYHTFNCLNDKKLKDKIKSWNKYHKNKISVDSLEKKFELWLPKKEFDKSIEYFNKAFCYQSLEGKKFKPSDLGDKINGSISTDHIVKSYLHAYNAFTGTMLEDVSLRHIADHTFDEEIEKRYALFKNVRGLLKEKVTKKEFDEIQHFAQANFIRLYGLNPLLSKIIDNDIAVVQVLTRVAALIGGAGIAYTNSLKVASGVKGGFSNPGAQIKSLSKYIWGVSK